MTNDPANVAALLRSLAVYAVCAVLAIITGVLMTDPMTYSSLGFIAVLASILFLPILLRWHHPLMIFAWNTPISLFFLKGSPKLCLAMIALSLAISITERALGQRRFISVPQITWPLLLLIGIIIATAKLTGGIGLRAFGSDVYGGKKYVFLIVGILGYFAVTARPIPPKWARLYVMLFFAAGALSAIGDFASIAPKFLFPLFLFIPPTFYVPGSFEIGTTRLIGTAWGATALVSAFLAYYGIRGIFLSGKLWRPIVFFILIVLVFFGGFRSALIGVAGLTLLLFFLEGLHRTRAMPLLVLFSFICAACLYPFASKLPYTFQRTLAFLPRDWIHLAPDARLDAQGSLDWRLDMWATLLPQIPQHLLLGKGYAITMEDYENMGRDSAFRSLDPGDSGLALAGDYHSGPLSVILPFGIWGVIAFVWFMVAAWRVIYCNYRYSIPEYRMLNRFLFASFAFSTFSFIFVFGDLASGVADFTGLIGLSVSLNRGVRRAPVKAQSRTIPFRSTALQPVLPGRIVRPV